jgi:DNA-binding transcriptional LysR family regulator
MQTPDLNLLITLEALLTEGSVTRAAQRLSLSQSAMSRALARLREATGDPLLVRAGRGSVPTPRALVLRDQIGQIVQDAIAALSPLDQLDLNKLIRCFSIRTSEGFVENFGSQLIERVKKEAPGVLLRFVTKSMRESASLRDGTIDLETGVVVQNMAPEMRVQALFRDRFIGVVRIGHSFCDGDITLTRYANGGHILVSRTGLPNGPIDEGLEELGLKRNIATIVGGFSTALALARSTDLIASVPERHTHVLRLGMYSFPLPLHAPDVTVSMIWHPRLDSDPAHRWFRGCVRDVCAD